MVRTLGRLGMGREVTKTSRKTHWFDLISLALPQAKLQFRTMLIGLGEYPVPEGFTPGRWQPGWGGVSLGWGSQPLLTCICVWFWWTSPYHRHSDMRPSHLPSLRRLGFHLGRGSIKSPKTGEGRGGGGVLSMNTPIVRLYN